MLTATTQRGAPPAPRANLSIRACAPCSSLTTTTGFSPVIVRKQRRGRACMRAVVAQHEPGGVGDHRASLEQQRIRVAQHPWQQRRRGIDRGAEPPRVVARIELVGERRDGLLGVDAPAQRRVEQSECQRPADRVGHGVGVAVHEVRRAAAVRVVRDGRDRSRIRAKRRAGQGEPSLRAVECCPQRGSPRRGLARVVDLVEDDERRSREVVGEQVRRGRDLLVRDGDAVGVAAPRPVGVAPARVEMQTHAVGGVRPLRSQRRRRADDDELFAAGCASRSAGGERLARAWRGHEQEVALGAEACRARNAACQARGCTVTLPAHPSRDCTAGTGRDRLRARSDRRRETGSRGRRASLVAVRCRTARSGPRRGTARRARPSETVGGPSAAVSQQPGAWRRDLAAGCGEKIATRDAAATSSPRLMQLPK